MTNLSSLAGFQLPEAGGASIKPTTLYDEDHAQHNIYDSSYNYSLSWAVPSYAPSGAYHVILTGTGNSSTTAGKVLCVNADFTL